MIIAWYEIVLLFMLVGSGCVTVGILTGLEAKRYKAQIQRENQMTDTLKALCLLLTLSNITFSARKRSDQISESDT